MPIGPAKQRGMIAVLLYHAGLPVRAETIIDLLWDPKEKADHRPTLYSFASRLRAVLAQVGSERALLRVAGTGSYRLAIDPATVDLHRFRRLLANARDADDRGNPESAAEILVGALALWRGDPLAELRGPRAEQLRRSLHDTLADAHKLLAECWLACGRPHSVLAQLEPVLEAHELDEALARCWVRALRAVGRHSEAKRFAGDFRRRFRREMRAEPDIDIDPPGIRSSRSAPEVTPRHLPPDIADFTGRQALLDQLHALRGPVLPLNNVVVITGMPGVGKTTLATHWAHRQRQNFPDGQLYLDAGAYGLAKPIDPADAIDRFLRILGVPPDQIPVTLEQRRDRFEDLIGDRRILILIDNVLDSTQVRPLIPRSMSCLTVITSRNRLSGLSIRNGVRTVSATPLPETESMALLARIVGDRGSAEAGDLLTLARLSGGLPLAVRIIGEHVAERPRAGIGELIGELRHRLLDATDEDDQAACLTTVFDWSYRALRPDAARLFRRIAIHPGSSISSEAAAAIVGAEVPDAEILLNTLAKAHMINHDTARRYRFHSLLHRYALERAAAEDDPATAAREQRRLLDWYLLSAAGAVAVIAPEWSAMPGLPPAPEIRPKTFPADTDALAWCDAERDNILAVSRWAAQNGYHRHGWQIPGVVHEILDRYGGQGDILKLNQLALAAARTDGHELGEIGTLINLGTTYFAVHDYDRAVATFVAARQLAATTGYVEEEIAAAHNLASTYLSLGEVSRAVEIYEEALLACRSTDHVAGEAAVLHWLGEAHLRLGRYQRSVRSHRQALAIREQIGAKRGMGQSHSSLGALHLALGNLRPARWHCETALALHRRTHDQKAECDTLITLTEVRSGLGLNTEAIADGQRAALLSEQITDSFRQVKAATALAGAFAAADDLVAAGQQVRTARRVLGDLSGVHVPPLHERLVTVEQLILDQPPRSRTG
ncbi:DNA-binding SARP family transcriptional activator [Actinoplanes tereljensis]|uniref:AfsR/SARP family transcriptional regulator n=1 Tax=Paractinoplanes tereljensis TaxID=571912 RepID=UPI001943BB3C|nr:tetratricopeptide repeat protein [Actinoplanes tereljensis]